MRAVAKLSYEVEDRDWERALGFIVPDLFGGCWLWGGPLNKTGGYGILAIDRKDDHRWLFAHRVVFTRLRGPVPPQLTLDHRCRVRCCVNPKHLLVCTKAHNLLENSVSPVALNFAKTACKHGHEFTPENTYVIPGRGHRNCRICRRDALERWRKAA